MDLTEKDTVQMYQLKLFREARRNEMMSDEDSRDSGICDIDFASMPTTFGSIMPTNFRGFPSVMNNDVEMKELDEDTDTMCQELMQTDESQEPGMVRRGLSDITNSASNFANQQDDTSRFDFSKRHLYDESPKSRTLFARPAPLGVKNLNVNLNAEKSGSQVVFSRKRTFGGFELPSKRSCHSFVEDVGRPSTSSSNEVKVAPCFNRILKANGSALIHRAVSSSILERGEKYSKTHADLPQLLEVKYNLKTLSPTCSNAFRRITASTLHELLLSMKDEEFRDRFLLVDCRYPYEYEGGHIKHAINLFDPAECEMMFYNPDGTKKDERIPIFYCEYSQKRGPSMACLLRRVDRQRNELKYPHCDYQEMYVLDKGFRNFYLFTRDERLSTMCQPDNYVTMDDSRFTCELKKWSFHKKAAGGATSIRVAEARGPFNRQLSLDSQAPSATPMGSRTSSRRPLFLDKSPSSFGLSVVPEARTPSPPFEKILQPHFS